ncbi:MAG: glucose 1-dehydrogenase [Microscillaceae bacterium]|nr:glucose 1-dehydrogenase [Microscillaceae bacterium]MDW8461211.1 glucose 1-dehydrogenase [Cytophagales bacterium]
MTQRANKNIDSLFSLEGKVALVTGSSKGIGEAMLRTFAQYGAKVVVSSRKIHDIEAIAHDINKKGGEAIAIAANMSNPQDIDNLVRKIEIQFGRIDIVVNNAAANPVYGPVEDCSIEAFDKIMNVNVKGPFLLCKAALPLMKKNGGGSIINISSIGGISPEEFLGIYSTSKAALIMLTKVMAKEWGKYGIRANAICPGLIETKFSQAMIEDERTIKRFLNSLPIARIGQPEDISGLALYLASEASSYTTGAVFVADGGVLI